MIHLTPYLLFDGACRPAMEFYRSCLGGELTLVRVADSPVRDQMPPALHDRVLHACLKAPAGEISASDWLRPDRQPVPGNTVCLFLSGGSTAEVEALFARLSRGGQVTDPLRQMPVGTYGALNDQFGVRWMFHAEA